MILYFIKINLALGLFYMAYRLLFQNDTCFKLRRFTLIGILCFAFIYPLPDIKPWVAEQPILLLCIEYLSSFYASSSDSFLTEELTSMPLDTIAPAETVAITPAAIDWRSLIGTVALAIYALGVLVLFFRSIVEIVSIHRIYKSCQKQKIHNIPLLVSAQIEEPYSFFHWIFIDPQKYDRQALSEILIHEQTHQRQLHSLDVVLGECVTILCWINPFAWLIKKEIRINHEYIADQAVMHAGFNKKEYQYHLIGMKHIPLAAANLYNYFSVLPLKKRITMLNKKRMPRAGIIKYLALMPLAAALLFVNNMETMARIVPEVVEPARIISATPSETIPETPEAPLPPDDKVYTVADEMPKYPGGDAQLLKYIVGNLKYPASAVENKIEGRVVVSFIVEKDGSISQPEIRRSIDPALDNEAIRVINTLPQWTPGKNNGEIVRVKYTVPVQFRLMKKQQEEVIPDRVHKGEKVYTVVDHMPRYQNGDPALLKFFADNLQYPAHAKEQGIEGRVIVSFIVEKEGAVADAQVVRSVDPELDKEALRVVNLTTEKWTPGREKDQPVHTRYVVPVSFDLKK